MWAWWGYSGNLLARDEWCGYDEWGEYSPKTVPGEGSARGSHVAVEVRVEPHLLFLDDSTPFGLDVANDPRARWRTVPGIEYKAFSPRISFTDAPGCC